MKNDISSYEKYNTISSILVYRHIVTYANALFMHTLLLFYTKFVLFAIKYKLKVYCFKKIKQILIKISS